MVNMTSLMLSQPVRSCLNQKGSRSLAGGEQSVKVVQGGNRGMFVGNIELLFFVLGLCFSHGHSESACASCKLQWSYSHIKPVEWRSDCVHCVDRIVTVLIFLERKKFYRPECCPLCIIAL